MKNKYIYISFIIVLVLDIITKILVIKNLIENQSIHIIKTLINITYVKNTGVAFSYLEGNRIFIILATLFIIIIIINNINKNILNNQEQISYGLIIGGAIGNLIDRLIYGYVIDFIDIKIINYNFPIFNIADSAIVIGVIILIYQNLKKESSDYHETNSNKRRKNR